MKNNKPKTVNLVLSPAEAKRVDAIAAREGRYRKHQVHFLVMERVAQIEREGRKP